MRDEVLIGSLFSTFRGSFLPPSSGYSENNNIHGRIKKTLTNYHSKQLCNISDRTLHQQGIEGLKEICVSENYSCLYLDSTLILFENKMSLFMCQSFSFLYDLNCIKHTVIIIVINIITIVAYCNSVFTLWQ